MVGTSCSRIAKLSHPRLFSVFARDRLFRRLDEALPHAGVWIAGAPGVGKTTLIASYLDARGLKGLWYQVDASDADPAALCFYLGCAVADRRPGGAEELPKPTPEQTSDLPAFARRYFRAFFGHLDQPLVIVFDNSQEALVSRAFRLMMAEAVREAPDSIAIVVVSRQIPPAEFAGLRANGALALLEPTEMMLTEDEALGIQSVLGAGQTPATPEAIRRIHQLAHGWATGLKLLLQHGDLRALQNLDGQNAFTDVILFDYLHKEVFDTQSREAQDLLVRAALLPRITAAAAQRLSGNSEAGQILEDMYRSSNFTVKHGAGASAHYELHPLLRGCLLEQGRTALPQEERIDLILSACTLLDEDGEWEAAARLLVDAELWPQLAQLIVTHAPNLLAQGWHRTLSHWIGEVPSYIVAGDPWLLHWQGVALASFDPPGGRRSFEAAYDLFRQRCDATGQLLAWSAVVETIALEWADFSQLDPWLDEAEGLLAEHAEFPSSEVEARFVSSMFSALLFRRPQHPEIEHWAERLLAIVEHCPDPDMRVLLGANLMVYYALWVGRMSAVDRLIKATEPAGAARLDATAQVLWYTNKACYLWQRGRIDESREAVAAGRWVVDQTGVRLWDFLLCALDAYTALSTGDSKQGRAAVGQLENALDPVHKADLAHYHYVASLEALLAGNPIAAIQHTGIANDLATRYGGPHQVALGYLAHAQALHAAGRSEEASICLDRGRRIAADMRALIVEFQALLCEALFALDAGDQTGCAESLKAAFKIGAEEGYLNYNYFRPDVIARLCAFALEHDIQSAYAVDLIRERRLVPPGPEAERWPWPAKVYTLGRFSLVIDGAAVAANNQTQHKPIELLQAIIALGGRDVGHEKLIDFLWPDAESKAGRGALESTLLRLRRLLQHSEAILLSGGKLAFNPRVCWVDLWSLARRMGCLEMDFDAGFCCSCLLRSMEHIFTHYQGDFLELEAEQGWMLPIRERLRARLGKLAVAVASRLEADGRWSEALSVRRRVLALDALVESLHRHLTVRHQPLGSMPSGTPNPSPLPAYPTHRPTRRAND